MIMFAKVFTDAVNPCIILSVIVSFSDKGTADFFHGRPSAKARRIPSDLRDVLWRTLDMLNAAAELEDLKSPPGNRLEELEGDRAGWHSIRVNDQWRLIFRWSDAGPRDVALTDYH
jgi:proteic killer suppression protein